MAVCQQLVNFSTGQASAASDCRFRAHWSRGAFSMPTGSRIPQGGDVGLRALTIARPSSVGVAWLSRLPVAGSPCAWNPSNVLRGREAHAWEAVCPKPKRYLHRIAAPFLLEVHQQESRHEKRNNPSGRHQSELADDLSRSFMISPIQVPGKGARGQKSDESSTPD